MAAYDKNTRATYILLQKYSHDHDDSHHHDHDHHKCIKNITSWQSISFCVYTYCLL